MSTSTTARLMRRILPEVSLAKRVVSTSCSSRSARVAAVETLDIKRCPLHRTMESIEQLVQSPIQSAERHAEPVDCQIESKSTSAAQPFEAIPGPKGLPIIGTLFDYFKKDGLRFDKMFEAYRQRSLEYGPIYKEKIGPLQNVVISDPEIYSAVIRAETKTPIRREMEPMAHYRTKKGIGLGIVNSQGEEWYKYRSAVNKKMMVPKTIAEYCGSLGEVSDDFVTRLNYIRDDVNHEVPQLEKEIFKWAMESIGTLLFDERIGCLSNQPQKEAHAFIDNLQGCFVLQQPLMYNLPLYKYFPTKLWKAYEKYFDNVLTLGTHFVDKKVRAMQVSEENGETPDKASFLTYLLSQQSLSPSEAVETAVELLMSAVETTSNATVWCLYNLAKHPDVQSKMVTEINKALPNNETLTASKLSELPYVKSVLKETLRLFPITYATSRVLPADLEVAGYNIPKGTHVQANLWKMYRDPQYFSDPESFKPERWLRSENSGANLTKQNGLLNLVWGHGSRMCLGRRFAEHEMHMALSKIVQNFQLGYNHDDVEPILMTVMTPDQPVKISFTPRASS
ncbi:cytochrome P450 10-like [Gigantopelta aegis]|uniref:cytochrome P450 10-like n=1 Tax=Gigantopelta aegis TaxID=1735272 RepID=UPI001B88D27E|nr:cytochrome P450 10-like [Gigantopelta aegis]